MSEIVRSELRATLVEMIERHEWSDVEEELVSIAEKNLEIVVSNHFAEVFADIEEPELRKIAYESDESLVDEIESSVALTELIQRAEESQLEAIEE